MSSSVYLQPLGNVKPKDRIVLARPDFAITGSYEVESLTAVDKDRVHLRAQRVDAGVPQVIDDVFRADLSVGVVPPEKRALG